MHTFYNLVSYSRDYAFYYALLFVYYVFYSLERRKFEKMHFQLWHSQFWYLSKLEHRIKFCKEKKHDLMYPNLPWRDLGKVLYCWNSWNEFLTLYKAKSTTTKKSQSLHIA